MRSVFSAIALVFLASCAQAQSGPSPAPSPWLVNGPTISYDQGGLTIPSTVSGGSQGAGTVNVGAGYYVAGAQSWTSTGLSALKVGANGATSGNPFTASYNVNGRSGLLLTNNSNGSASGASLGLLDFSGDNIALGIDNGNNGLGFDVGSLINVSAGGLVLWNQTGPFCLANVASGPTTNCALKIAQGDTLMTMGAGGFTASGSVATALSSLGPSGSHTTVQEWFTVKDAAGTVRYIPAF